LSIITEIWDKLNKSRH